MGQDRKVPWTKRDYYGSDGPRRTLSNDMDKVNGTFFSRPNDVIRSNVPSPKLLAVDLTRAKKSCKNTNCKCRSCPVHNMHDQKCYGDHDVDNMNNQSCSSKNDKCSCNKSDPDDSQQLQCNSFDDNDNHDYYGQCTLENVSPLLGTISQLPRGNILLQSDQDDEIFVFGQSNQDLNDHYAYKSLTKSDFKSHDDVTMSTSFISGHTHDEADGYDEVDVAVARGLDLAANNRAKNEIPSCYPYSKSPMDSSFQSNSFSSHRRCLSEDFTQTKRNSSLASMGDHFIIRRMSIPETIKGHDYIPQSNKNLFFTIASSILSMMAFFFDVSTDVWIACLYYKHGHMAWFSLTLVFVVGPAVILSVFSFRWYVLDYKNVKTYMSHRHWTLRFLFVFLFVSPIVRFLDIIKFSRMSSKMFDANNFQAFKFWVSMMHFEGTDASLLHIFESFLEAAPQLVLQLYIMSVMGDTSGTFLLISQYASVVMSLLSLSWAIVSYARALRLSLSHKLKLTISGMILIFLWHLFIICARVLALAMFAATFKAYLLIIIGSHLIVMFAWIINQDTKFCDTAAEELVFDFVVSLIYLFCFVNVLEGPTRLRYVIFSVIVYLENVGMVVAWHISTQTEDIWYRTPVLLMVLVGYLVGILFQVIYYLKFHPNNLSPNSENKIKLWVPFKGLFNTQDICDESEASPCPSPSGKVKDSIFLKVETTV